MALGGESVGDPLRIATIGSRIYAAFLHLFLGGVAAAFLILAFRNVVGTVAVVCVLVAGVLWTSNVSTTLGADGIVVRNWYRTYRMWWDEIIGFQDGHVSAGEGVSSWALGIVSGSGKTLTCRSTSQAGRHGSAKIVAQLSAVASDHEVPATLTEMQEGHRHLFRKST